MIDLAKFVRTTLQDPTSVASLLITTEALVAEVPKEEKAAPVPAMDYCLSTDGGNNHHGSERLLGVAELVTLDANPRAGSAPPETAQIQ